LLGLGGMGGAPAPAPTPAAPAGSGGAGGMTPQCIALCLRNDGVLHEDANMQIGVKMEFANPPAAHQGRMALYFGNKTAEPFSSFATQLSPSPGLAIQAAAVPNTMQPRAQGQQMLMMECGAAYGEAPQIAVRFVANGAPVQLVLRLPLPASKFMHPLVVDAAEFFRRWKVFDGKEAQQIFKLAAVPLPEPMVAKVLSEGMKLALLKGVDPNPSNFVIAGWLPTKGCTPQGDAESVLMRLEINDAAGVCRISVRSGSSELNTALSKLIIGQLGKPE
jgi:AP-2 complex subunit alpha